MSKTTIAYKDVAPGAADDALYTSGSETSFSTLGLSNESNADPAYITGELNEFGLNGTFSTRSGAVPFWSEQLSEADCSFITPPEITVEFDEQYTSVGLTLVFSKYSWCSEVNIKWYQGSTLKADKDFLPDSNLYFCHQNVESYNKVIIAFRKTALPYKRAKLQYIMFGVNRTFDMTEIRNARITNQTNLISVEVPVSTLDWTLNSKENIDYIFQLKQPMEVRKDDSIVGVYYIDEHTRSGERLYSIRCKDAIGVLNDSTFAGGVYANKSAKTLINEIVNGAFQIDFRKNDATLTGIILPCSKRDAMQQVLFAWGACVATDGADKLAIFDASTSKTIISRNKTYSGASIETSAIVTEVRVTAHSYAAATDGDIEINGTKYKDTQTVYTVKNPNVTASDKENIIEVTDATLVSNSIGQATAQRVYDYYSKRKTGKAKIVWESTLLGDMVELPNSWGEGTSGNVEKLEMILSNTIAANVEVKS